MLWGPFPVRPLAMAAFLAVLALLIGLETPANAQRTGADVNADEIKQGAKATRSPSTASPTVPAKRTPSTVILSSLASTGRANMISKTANTIRVRHSSLYLK